MPEKAPNRIAEHRRKSKMTQQELADALDVHWMTISKLERGKIQLTEVWLRNIAKVLKVEFQDLVNSTRPVREILVKGVIQQGQYTLQDEEGPGYVEMTDEGPDLESDWYLVEGHDLEPFYYDGDAIKFTYYLNDDFQFLVGRLANVEFHVEPDAVRSVLAVLEKHLGENRFDLRTLKGLRFENVWVTDVGLITGHMIEAPLYPEDHPGRGDGKN